MSKVSPDVTHQKLEDHLHYHEKIDSLYMEKLDKLAEDMNKGMERIVSRQDIANGRTSKHDKILNKIIGGMIVVGAIVTGLLIPLTKSYLESKQDVSTQVREVLGEYLEKQ